MIDGKYIDVNEVLSRGNGVIFGKRGIGKSYGMRVRAIARRTRQHEAMVWCRFTEEEADKMFASFGNGKWQQLCRDSGVPLERLKQYRGRRILYKDDGDTWQPLIRYFGLSEWQKARDDDDPQEHLLFFDEFVVPEQKLKCHDGNPAEHFLDMWVSLRRGEKKRCPFLLAGNSDIGADWFTPYLGVTDSRKPESVLTYRVAENIRKKYSDERFDFRNITIQWTTNPGGVSSGGDNSGVAPSVPESLHRKRSPLSTIYFQCDFGDGLLSAWFDKDGVVFDTVKGNASVIKPFPDGKGDTTVYTPRIKSNMVFLRQYWRLGRVYFANADALHRFTICKSKLI